MGEVTLAESGVQESRLVLLKGGPEPLGKVSELSMMRIGAAEPPRPTFIRTAGAQVRSIAGLSRANTARWRSTDFPSV